MILKSLKYHRHIGSSREWGIEGKDSDMIAFGNINLLVGKNSTGKSRTLDVIKELGHFLSAQTTTDQLKFKSCTYRAILGNGSSQDLEYCLTVEGGIVVDEQIVRREKLLFDRKSALLYIEETDSYEKVELDSHKAVTQYTAENVPFLANIKIWGFSIRDSIFSDQIEKKKLADSLDDLDYKVIKRGEKYSLFHIFKKGCERFGSEFIDRIIKDMDSLNYDIESINIQEYKKKYTLAVKEKDLDFDTTQLEMSQGMFRVLSFIIRLNYAVLNKVSVCFLIDDLGEGLDFDRSKCLVSIIMRSLHENTEMQIFLTTNDRYIMNKIPLKFWSVIVRYPHSSKFYNYQNSKEIFDDFKYTGLSNFDFLSTDFYLKGFDEDASDDDHGEEDEV